MSTRLPNFHPPPPPTLPVHLLRRFFMTHATSSCATSLLLQQIKMSRVPARTLYHWSNRGKRTSRDQVGVKQNTEQAKYSFGNCELFDELHEIDSKFTPRQLELARWTHMSFLQQVDWGCSIIDPVQATSPIALFEDALLKHLITSSSSRPSCADGLHARRC
jgi:hypothetical protein